MATSTRTEPAFSRIVVRADSPAAAHYRAGREHAAIAHGFAPEPQLDLQKFPGRTVEQLTFTDVYLGGAQAWSTQDMQAIDASLAASMSDVNLNNVIEQYYASGTPTTMFKPSRVLPGPLADTVYRDTIEGFAAALDTDNGLSGLDLASTCICFMLPRGVVLVDGTSSGGGVRDRDDAADSLHGLGGYHGSIHAKHGTATDTVYYAVGVYSEGTNGIPAFDEPWKSVCATFYHELNEMRTDPDVEDAIRENSDSYLGWYSPKGGEIGDIPMEEAGANLSEVMVEVPLVRGGTAPIQLMWSNAVGGPEGPIAAPHPRAA